MICLLSAGGTFFVRNHLSYHIRWWLNSVEPAPRFLEKQQRPPVLVDFTLLVWSVWATMQLRSSGLSEFEKRPTWAVGRERQEPWRGNKKPSSRQEPVCKLWEKWPGDLSFQLENSESPLGLSCAQRTLRGQDCNEMSVTWLHPALCLPPSMWLLSTLSSYWDSGANSNQGFSYQLSALEKNWPFSAPSEKENQPFLSPMDQHPCLLCLSVALGALRHSNLNREGWEKESCQPKLNHCIWLERAWVIVGKTVEKEFSWDGMN